MTSCAVAGGDFCAVAHPIHVRDSGYLNAQTEREILSHDEFGAAHCGWEASGKLPSTAHMPKLPRWWKGTYAAIGEEF
jgi:hypothetical protein